MQLHRTNIGQIRRAHWCWRRKKTRPKAADRWRTIAV